MNNEIYMDFIEERLYVLKHRIILRSELNILNLNLRAEDFIGNYLTQFMDII